MSSFEGTLKIQMTQRILLLSNHLLLLPFVVPMIQKKVYEKGVSEMLAQEYEIALGKMRSPFVADGSKCRDLLLHAESSIVEIHPLPLKLNVFVVVSVFFP